MFIQARTHTPEIGLQRKSFFLVESRRIGVGGTREVITLLNLGQDFNLPKEDWQEFIKHVVARLKEESPPSSGKDQAFEQTVDDTVQRLQKRGFDANYMNLRKDFFIDPEKTVVLASRSVGGERLTLNALKLMKLDELLIGLGFMQKQVKLAYMLIIERMLNPASNQGGYDWILDTSSILELLDLDPPSLNTLYQCSNQLYAHRHEIMDGIFKATTAQLKLKKTSTFYDLTNVFFDEVKNSQSLFQEPNKRDPSDPLLRTLVLALNKFGFPYSMDILSGNASEPEMLEQIIQNLSGDPSTVIVDANLAAEECSDYVKKQGLDWISVDRTRVPMPDRIPEVQFKASDGTKVKAWTLSNEEDSVCVYIQNEMPDVTRKKVIEKNCARYEEELARLNEGLSKPGHMEDLIGIASKTRQLAGRFQLVSHLYNVTVIPEEGTETASYIQVTKLHRHPDQTWASGKYILRTSHTKWSLETIVQTYHRLSETKQTLQVMKTNLRLATVGYDEDERIEGHLFTAILAYHAAHLLLTKLRANDIHDSWIELRTELNKIKRETLKCYLNPESEINV